ncbi:hypothetical protein D9757_009979 [Collybiopsis confluens]|uniref:F-box domain-containing protein n=1 Tax=Collybiopsis confluens TaxID=2823264 RepID=A0A8H5GV16_9AGAR|nr:hypothetical protein D9757_009979 [Collybiopsis confluens]
MTCVTSPGTLFDIDKVIAELGAGEAEDPQLLQRSRINAIPESATERLQMSLAIDEAALELESCNKAINELKNRLARLKKCRRNLIRRKGSLLSPIQTLPPEVLRLVFSYVKRPIEASSPESRRIRIRSPVFGLTWVCAHWRAIGLSERHLWDDYMVDWRSYRQFTPIFRAFLKECFEVRAQKAPVDLELVSSILTPAVTPVLDIVLKSPQRWRNIIIRSDNSNYALLDHLPVT